jgi:hypothetical protein
MSYTTLLNPKDGSLMLINLANTMYVPKIWGYKIKV